MEPWKKKKSSPLLDQIFWPNLSGLHPTSIDMRVKMLADAIKMEDERIKMEDVRIKMEDVRKEAGHCPRRAGRDRRDPRI